MLLAAGLVSHGVDVHCYCEAATRSADVPGVTFHDVPCIRVGEVSLTSRFAHPLERVSFAVAATRALRRDRELYDVVDVRQTAALEGDVLQVHGVVVALQARWAAETGRTFRAARLRSFVSPAARPQIAVDRGIQKLQLRRGRFSRVIAVTGQVRDDLFRFLGVAPEMIDVVPPPIDLDRIGTAQPSGIRTKLGIPDKESLALFVGHSFRRKGLDKLIEALAGISEVHLVVIGEDDPLSVRDLIEHANIARRVHFVGKVDDPERYYAEADLLVLPTRTEPWGIPLIEAMAAGIPVISTSIAGAAQVVTRAKAGIILSDDSTSALRDAILALITDPDLRRRMGERGRVAALRFSAESHAEAVLRTYRRALSNADSRRD